MLQPWIQADPQDLIGVLILLHRMSEIVIVGARILGLSAAMTTDES